MDNRLGKDNNLGKYISIADNLIQFYMCKKEVTLTAKNGSKIIGDAQFDIDIDLSDGVTQGSKKFNTNEEKYIVGISKFAMFYPAGTDRHVHKVGLTLEPKLTKNSDNTQTVDVKIKAELADTSSHSIVKLILGITLIAISETTVVANYQGRKLYGKQETTQLLALTGFETQYEDNKDHHVKLIEVTLPEDTKGGQAFMLDNSKHEGNSNKVAGKRIDIPISVLAYMELEDCHLINAFKLSMGSVDHHIAKIEVEYRRNNALYYLEDVHGNQACINQCYCSVDTYKN